MQRIVFTPDFLVLAKISLSEEQRPVVTEDSVSVESLASILGS